MTRVDVDRQRCEKRSENHDHRTERKRYLPHRPPTEAPPRPVSASRCTPHRASLSRTCSLVCAQRMRPARPTRPGSAPRDPRLSSHLPFSPLRSSPSPVPNSAGCGFTLMRARMMPMGSISGGIATRDRLRTSARNRARYILLWCDYIGAPSRRRRSADTPCTRSEE
jgi:hypothetical protein